MRGGGSIPAHAGQPKDATPGGHPTGVHPRSRGAASVNRLRKRKGPGPSPLTRGSHVPAVACGAGQGPSPLTRGSHRRNRPAQGNRGSLPAHAGQPEPVRHRTRMAGVHPRSRGAASAKADQVVSYYGPSPLTRGSQRWNGAKRLRHGSIPAHAGQPATCAARMSKKRVHPRSRGAARSPTPQGSTVKGPSPLTRGSHQLVGRALVLGGSIPAHAGQPPSRPAT